EAGRRPPRRRRQKGRRASLRGVLGTADRRRDQAPRRLPLSGSGLVEVAVCGPSSLLPIPLSGNRRLRNPAARILGTPRRDPAASQPGPPERRDSDDGGLAVPVDESALRAAGALPVCGDLLLRSPPRRPRPRAR